MRFVMKLTLPPEPFNKYVKDGSIGKKMEMVLGDTKPEAAYFTAVDGCRGGFIIINMENTSQIPAFAEPWFLWFDAKVEFLPTMLPEDLAQAGLEGLGKKWS